MYLIALNGLIYDVQSSAFCSCYIALPLFDIICTHYPEDIFAEIQKLRDEMKLLVRSGRLGVQYFWEHKSHC